MHKIALNFLVMMDKRQKKKRLPSSPFFVLSDCFSVLLFLFADMQHPQGVSHRQQTHTHIAEHRQPHGVLIKNTHGSAKNDQQLNRNGKDNILPGNAHGLAGNGHAHRQLA